MSYVNTYYLKSASDNGLQLDSEDHKHSILPLTYADDFVVDSVNSIIKKRNLRKYKQFFPGLSEDIMTSSFIGYLWDIVEKSGLANDINEFYCRFGFGIYACKEPGIKIMLMVNTKGKI